MEQLRRLAAAAQREQRHGDALQLLEAVLARVPTDGEFGKRP